MQAGPAWGAGLEGSPRVPAAPRALAGTPETRLFGVRPPPPLDTTLPAQEEEEVELPQLEAAPGAGPAELAALGLCFLEARAAAEAAGCGAARPRGGGRGVLATAAAALGVG
jgi:hypothetical protein